MFAGGLSTDYRLGERFARHTFIKLPESRESESISIYVPEVGLLGVYLYHASPADFSHASVPMHLHPTSALAGLGFLPDFTVYHEVHFRLLRDQLSQPLNVRFPPDS